MKSLVSIPNPPERILNYNDVIYPILQKHDGNIPIYMKFPDDSMVCGDIFQSIVEFLNRDTTGLNYALATRITKDSIIILIFPVIESA